MNLGEDTFKLGVCADPFRPGHGVVFVHGVGLAAPLGGDDPGVLGGRPSGDHRHRGGRDFRTAQS